MKKLLCLSFALAIILSLSACGGSSTGPAKSAAEAQRDFPEGDYSDTGVGSFYISTPSGTSEGGAIPVIFIGTEVMVQIGANAWDFDGTRVSFVYIDGVLNTEEQFANTQASLNLSGGALATGLHSVEVVQYVGDSPDGEIVTYKPAFYEVKSK